MSILLCGVDEVGRGAFAGPMFAVAAVFDSPFIVENAPCPIPGVKDSKSFSNSDVREEVYQHILHYDHLVDIGIGEVSVDEIDSMGMTRANRLAFRRAQDDLKHEPHFIIVDGELNLPWWPKEHQLVKPKADALYWPVSAASVLAKVIRDRLMVDLSRQHPQYDWENNKGYGSEKHREALKACGPCSLHRRTFIEKYVQIGKLPTKDS